MILRRLAQLILALLFLGGGGAIFALLVLTKTEAASKPPVEKDWVVDSVVLQRANLQPTLRLQGQIIDRKSTRLNSSHSQQSRMPSSA